MRAFTEIIKEITEYRWNFLLFSTEHHGFKLIRERQETGGLRLGALGGG
jgi:hypothetical protein